MRLRYPPRRPQLSNRKRKLQKMGRHWTFQNRMPESNQSQTFSHLRPPSVLRRKRHRHNLNHAPGRTTHRDRYTTRHRIHPGSHPVDNLPSAIPERATRRWHSRQNRYRQPHQTAGLIQGFHRLEGQRQVVQTNPVNSPRLRKPDTTSTV